jgi:Tol biopolymer transport system component
MSSVFWSNDGESVYFHLDGPSNMLVKYGSDKINDEDDMVVVLDKLPVIRGISLTPLTRNEILFYSQYRGSNKMIISHNLRTGIKTELTQNYEDTSPKISPDGKTIVFCRRELPNSNIFYLYQMDSDGKNLNRICNVSSKNCDFNLSNDGKRIIYTNNKGIFSIGLKGGFSENLKATGNCPVMSVNEKHLYFADGKSLYKKSLTITGASIQFVHYFNGIIQDFRLSPDGKFSSVLYNNIVTIISLDKVPPNTFIPILDGKCPIEDAIWSLDNKWLYLRRGLPKQDLIKISTSDFDITKAEVVYSKLITDSITQITLIN